MRGAKPPLPNTPSCRGAYLSTGTTSTLPLLYLTLTSQSKNLFMIQRVKRRVCKTGHLMCYLLYGIFRLLLLNLITNSKEFTFYSR
jgi:hypothetical protein